MSFSPALCAFVCVSADLCTQTAEKYPPLRQSHLFSPLSDTANLASLLVDTKSTRLVLENIEDAVALNVPLCVYANTGADAYIKLKHKQAKRVPFDSELESFQGLNDGQCEATVAYYQNWLGYESQRAYNPDCDLEWVGRAVKSIQSGFAVTADTGHKCSSLIRDVLDLYLNELLESGFIEDMWDQHYSKTQDINCDAVRPEVLAAGTTDDGEGEESEEDGETRRRRLGRKLQSDMQLRRHHAEKEKHFNPHPLVSSSSRERRLQEQTEQRQQQRRKLKASGRSGAAAAGGFFEPEASHMTINQMAGTFLLHYGVSAFAVLVAYFTRRYNNKHRHHVKAFVEKRISTWKSTRSSKGGKVESRPASHWNGSTIESSNNDLDDVNDGINKDSNRNGARSVSFAKGELKVVSLANEGGAEALRSVQDELRETKAELKQTREEMSEQMYTIRALLEQIQKDKQEQRQDGSNVNNSNNDEKSNGTGIRGLFF